MLFEQDEKCTGFQIHKEQLNHSHFTQKYVTRKLCYCPVLDQSILVLQISMYQSLLVFTIYF